MNLINKGRLLAIDHGIKRIGLAVSDTSQLIARELTVIQRKSRAEDFAKINHIAREQSAIAIVIGMPNNDHLDPGVYSQADTVKLWAERFAETTTLPLILWDEQLTSADAKELARNKKRKWHEPIDDLAARVILQSYLDALRDGLATLPLNNDEG
ncbi:MAG: Holliday junction resolvase RuvX [Anaerolineae bacterium]|nr:Holliday junction resolvase RuvX [Anaerolineae bacterium]